LAESPLGRKQQQQQVNYYRSNMVSIPHGDDAPSNNHDGDADGAAAAVAMHQTGQNDSLLAVENERLRKELLELRRKINKLEDNQENYNNFRVSLPSLPKLKRSPEPKNNDNNNNVVLELPPVIGNNRRATKDHQSVSTADDRETVEPHMDIESHASAGGLHHRSPRSQTYTKTININSKTPPTASLTDEDDEDSSSKDLYDDPLAEARGLIHTTPSAENDGIMRAVVESTNNSSTEAADPSHRQMTFLQTLTDRAGWLIGLLVFQSLSSFILARNESLLQQHTVIVHFLTMLVGAGGNAGNQASVGVVRGIAIGTVNRSNARKVLAKEFIMGVALSLILGLAGLLRAKVFAVPWWETMAITTSLYMIVIISVILGASLPLGMEAIGIDPAHSSTTIQVVMDITGVIITVHVSRFMLDSNFHDWLDSKFNPDL